MEFITRPAGFIAFAVFLGAHITGGGQIAKGIPVACFSIRVSVFSRTAPFFGRPRFLTGVFLIGFSRALIAVESRE